MPLLKSNQPAQSVKPKPMTPHARAEFSDVEAQKVIVVKWPEVRRQEGIGASIHDGWNFGIGFGLALTIALPIILAVIGCALWVLLAVLGLSL